MNTQASGAGWAKAKRCPHLKHFKCKARNPPHSAHRVEYSSFFNTKEQEMYGGHFPGRRVKPDESSGEELKLRERSKIAVPRNDRHHHPSISQQCSPDRQGNRFAGVTVGRHLPVTPAHLLILNERTRQNGGWVPGSRVHRGRW